MTQRFPSKAAFNIEAAIQPAELPDTVAPARPQGRVLCSDINIRIDREGVWYYDDSAISRKELVCLFASVLARDAAGRFWLVTPAEISPVQVEDAPFLGVELFAAGVGEALILTVRTNIDELVTIDDAHPLNVTFDPVSGEPSPYVRVRPGLTARLNRPVYYALVDHGVEREVDGETVFGVWSRGSFFALGRLDAEP